MGRLTTLIAAWSVVLLVSGCSVFGTGESTADSADAPGCGDCRDELEAVRSEIEELAEVRELRTLEKYGDSPTNGATVNLEIESSARGDTGLADEVARIVWQSELAPVDVVTIAIKDASGEVLPLLPYDFRDDSRQRETYEERWGPRPVE